MNILVVDDEDIARAGIRKSLAGETSFRIVAECSNGRQALELLKVRSDVDLILLDLNMPVMDGIEFLNLLDPSFQGKIVVLSGYDDLEHVKEAMKRGACDYFHKPAMSPKRIREMIRAIEEKESTSVQEHYAHQKTEEWIKQLICDPSPELLENSLHWLARATGNLYTILISVDHLDEMTVSTPWMRDRLGTLRNSHSFNSEFAVWGENRYLVIISLSTTSMSKSLKFIRKQCLHLKASAYDAGILLTFGVSRECGNPLDLHNCVAQSEKALERSFFTGPGNVIFFEPNKADAQELQLHEHEEAIWEALQEPRESTLLETIGTYFAALEVLNDRKRVVLSVMELLFDLKSGLERDGVESAAQRISVEWVLSLKYLSDLRDYVTGTLLECFKAIRTFGSEDCSPMVRHAKQYILKHFSEAIALEELAEMLNTNPSYLSRTFREQTGTTISEFISNLRISRARELLRQPELRVSDVALRVGYSSEKHFSHVFKRETGSTPSQYRKNVLSNLHN